MHTSEEVSKIQFPSSKPCSSCRLPQLFILIVLSLQIYFILSNKTWLLLVWNISDGTLYPYSYPIPGVSVYRVIQGYLFFIVGETSCRLVTQIWERWIYLVGNVLLIKNIKNILQARRQNIGIKKIKRAMLSALDWGQWQYLSLGVGRTLLNRL